MDAPALASASGPVYRSVIILAVAYWRAACRMPFNDDVTIGSLLRIPTPHMKAVRIEIFAALAQITPFLDREYERAADIRNRGIQTAQRMRDKGAQRKVAALANERVAVAGYSRLAQPQRAPQEIATQPAPNQPPIADPTGRKGLPQTPERGGFTD